MKSPLESTDPEIAAAIRAETAREAGTLEMIASENFVSEAVLEAMGSVFTNKYAEGYPGRRYYGGCGPSDTVEDLARRRAIELFGAEHANVQPHSGTQANTAVYMTVCKPGDTVLGMNLSHGGHLTHGHPLNFSGIMYKIVPYGVTRDTETIDYNALELLAREHRPRLIVIGASAYSRTIDFERIGRIARSVDAKTMADIAHIAGLVAAGLHPSPVPHCDFVTSTTHKTLRGPRSGLVLCRKEYAKDLDRIVFPGIQGGPHVHIIAAKAVAFHEALQPGFRDYQRRIVENAKALADAVAGGGYRIVSGGTDNHLFLVDVAGKGSTGKVAEKALEESGITVNKNSIPFDTLPPLTAGGIRVGTPAVTTRGLGVAEMKVIGGLMVRVLSAPEDAAVHQAVRSEVAKLCERFPLYASRLAGASASGPPAASPAAATKR
jgi:glycine hydroxymethyltransferase